jgi:hypothetical protein
MVRWKPLLLSANNMRTFSEGKGGTHDALQLYNTECSYMTEKQRIPDINYVLECADGNMLLADSRIEY